MARNKVLINPSIETYINRQFDKCKNQQTNLNKPIGRFKNFCRKVRAYDGYMLYAHVARAAYECQPNAKVLDTGAGQCQYKHMFSHAHYVSCDFAKGDKDWDYSNIDVYCDLEATSFPDREFDICILIEVIEHLRYPDKVLQEINRILKINGRLYITARQCIGEHQKPHDYYRFTTFSLKDLAERAGFKVEEIVMRTGFLGFLSGNISLAYDLYIRAKFAKLNIVYKIILIIPFIFSYLLLVALELLLFLADTDGDVCPGYNCIFTVPAPLNNKEV